MKIAIATEGTNVAGHFGRCQTYTYFTIENDKIVNKEVLDNPGHAPGFLPEYLSEKNVDIIISGGMGGRAQDLFIAKDIEVIVGTTGSVDEVAQGIIDGTIKSTKSVCEAHAFGDGSCGN